jgi:ArpU family phage transcriptional regulator
MMNILLEIYLKTKRKNVKQLVTQEKKIVNKRSEHMTVTYEEVKLPTKIRRKAEQILSSYRNIDAIIFNLEKSITCSMKVTPSYQLRESSSGGTVGNPVEELYIKQEEIQGKLESKQELKDRLDKIHNSFNDRQKTIWELRYIRGWFDQVVMAELQVTNKTYYREKNKMISVVAESFCLI